MSLFLAVHARYTDVQLGIFKDGTLIEEASDESKKISRNFISLLDGMLTKSNHTLAHLNFIAVHQGPAPFTTLRVCITMANGLAFATGIPLVGVNGLQELIEEHKKIDGVTVALLNAFSQEVYFGIDDPFNQNTAFGYAPAASFIKDLSAQYQTPITFVGNGIELYQDLIQKSCGERAHLLSPSIVSLERIAHKALIKWEKKEIHSQLMPLYLKDFSATLKPAF